jgi:hypothetical protein
MIRSGGWRRTQLMNFPISGCCRTFSGEDNRKNYVSAAMMGSPASFQAATPPRRALAFL